MSPSLAAGDRLTIEDIRRAMTATYRPAPTLFEMIAEPWPHLVYYRHGRVTYVPPDRFLFQTSPHGPSDCTWIVPGTLEKRL